MKLRNWAIGMLLVLVLAGCGGTTEQAATAIQSTATVASEAPAEPTNTEGAEAIPTDTEEAEPTDTVPAVVEPTSTIASPAETEAPETPAGSVVTYAEIKAQREALTEAQWPAYEKELLGKRIEAAEGYVHQVDTELFGDRPALRVDLDKPSGVLDAYELEVIIPETYAAKLNKGQGVTVSGEITKLECFMTYCNVKLENGSFTAEGTLAEPVFEKQSGVTHEMINAKRKEITYAQWGLYMASIKGARISGSGYVEDVQKSFLSDDFEVQIDLQAPTEAMSSYEIKVPIPTDEAAKFSKDQAVIFDGTVEGTECFIDFCNVTVKGTVTAE